MKKSTLVFGKDVLISGFGKFRVKKKSARKSRNPETGEGMMPASHFLINSLNRAVLGGKLVD
ncbi:MAG: hypothetical protein GY850_37520 [bacterium]|nr:hypothetical protein [bacterium]